MRQLGTYYQCDNCNHIQEDKRVCTECDSRDTQEITSQDVIAWANPKEEESRQRLLGMVKANYDTENSREAKILELLKKVKEFLLEDTNFIGMCGVVIDLELAGDIDPKESRILKDYIKENRQRRVYRYNRSFWWKPENKTPRIKWLNQRIALHEKIRQLIVCT